MHVSCMDNSSAPIARPPAHARPCPQQDVLQLLIKLTDHCSSAVCRPFSPSIPTGPPLAAPSLLPAKLQNTPHRRRRFRGDPSKKDPACLRKPLGVRTASFTQSISPGVAPQSRPDLCAEACHHRARASLVLLATPAS